MQPTPYDRLLRADRHTAAPDPVPTYSRQGLCWSVTVLLCIDLCGPKLRGLASGLNETVGYSAVAIFVEVYSLIEKRSVSCAWCDSSRLVRGAQKGE